MSRYSPVEPLRPDHDTSAFDCGSAQQTGWLRRYAMLAQQAGTARVYVACRSGGQSVAGYYALSAGSIIPGAAPARVASGTGRHPIPVVILTRLGVDLAEQGRGLGSALVRDALQRVATAAGEIGIRALLIHAESPAAADFYRGLDPAFQQSPTDDLHLLILVKDIRTAIQRAADQGDAGPRIDDYEEARRRAEDLMAKATPHGGRNWTRDDIYGERGDRPRRH